MDAKILIVEDERDIVDLLRYNLQEAGFETDYVRNGADALHRAVEKPPDLILLDLMLPEVDGLIVCRLLKNDPRTKNIPIVMVTAKVEERDRVAGLELGADDYITNPLVQEKLYSVYLLCYVASKPAKKQKAPSKLKCTDSQSIWTNIGS